MRRRLNLETNSGVSAKSMDRTNSGHSMKQWTKKRKPKLFPLVILDTPLKSSISQETIREVVRLAILKSKLKS
jgi:hypothetical protein